MTRVDGQVFDFEDCALYCVETGTGPPVVFIHGFGLDHRMWTPQWEAMAGRFRLIRYDVRGFGRSSLPGSAPYAHERDLHALLNRLNALPAHLIGLSMGGRLALRFALAYPGGVRSLVLVDSAADGHPWSGEWQAAWEAIVAATRAGGVDEAKRLWLEHPLFKPARRQPGIARLLHDMVDDYSGWHWGAVDPVQVPAPPALERLGEIAAPALVITGEEDIPDFHQIASRLAAGIARSRNLLIPHAGHMANLENPVALQEAIEAFLPA